MSSSTSNSEPILDRSLASAVATTLRSHRGIVIGLSITLLGITIASCLLLTQLFDRPNWKSMAIEALNPDIEYLALGSSHVQFALNPNLMPGPAMNIAANYLDARSMLAAWRKYSPRLPNLKAVIVELGAVNVEFSTEHLNPKGLRDLGILPWPSAATWLTEPSRATRLALWPLWTWRLSPEFVRLHKQAFQPGPEVPDAQAGFIPTRLKLAFPESYAKRKAEFFTKTVKEMPAWVAESNRRAYDELVAELKAADLNFVLIRYPIFKESLPFYPEMWTESIRNTRERLRKQCEDCEFWDFSRLDLFEKSDFRDPEHLNSAGAELFTDHVGVALREWIPPDGY